jgi:hypothetical protein
MTTPRYKPGPKYRYVGCDCRACGHRFLPREGVPGLFSRCPRCGAQGWGVDRRGVEPLPRCDCGCWDVREARRIA